MPLNVITFPFLLCHSDNPIPLEIEASDVWQNFIPGATWGWWIIFTSGVVDAGTTITFELYGTTIVVEMFPAAATIDDSGEQVHENTGLSIDDWLNTVFIPTVQQNYYLSQCSFAVAGGYLFINAPYDTNLVVDTDIPGATPQLIGIGTPDVWAENYTIVCDVFATQTGAAEQKVASLNAIPLKVPPYTATFDLSSIAAAYVERELPTFGQSSPTLCEKPIAVLRVEFAEGYGTPPSYKKRYTNIWQTFLCVKGAIPRQHFPQAFPLAVIDASDHWLTWKPRTLKVSKRQNEYLYWLPIYSVFYPDPTITASVRGRITFTDQSYIDVTYIGDLSYERFLEYIIPAGYEQLGVGSFDPSKTVERWTVYMYAVLPVFGPQLVSPTQVYILDTKCAEDRSHYFLFGNSLNGFDTLRTTTRAEVGVKVEREDFMRTMGWDHPPEEAGKTIHSLRAAKRLKVSTGWLDKATIQWLQEFVTSDEIYIEQNGQHLPVRLLGDTFALYLNDSHLYALDFEVEYITPSEIYATDNLIHI